MRSAPKAYVLHAPTPYRFPRDRRELGSWEHAEQRLRESRSYWLVTVRPDGRPHATPLWGVWLEYALFLDGPPTTTWGRNLTLNPEVTIHVESASDTVILEGRIEDLTTDGGLARRIAQAWDEKYGRLVPMADSRGILRLRPRRARSWSHEDLTDGTGWRFERPAGSPG